MKKMEFLRLICKFGLITTMLLAIVSCSSTRVTKEDVLRKGFNDIIIHLDSDEKISKDEKLMSDINETIKRESTELGLVGFVLNSKLSERALKIETTKSKKQEKINKKKFDKAGIGSFKDTIPYKALHILDSEKCSLLKEKKIIVRKNLALCLQRKKLLPFLHFLYTYEKLREIDRICRLNQSHITRKLNLEQSRNCYHVNYKNGKFISPLTLIN